MRIIFVITGLLKGGAERQLSYLIDHISPDNKVIICAFVDGYYGDYFRQKNHSVIILPKNLSSFSQFIKLVNEFKPDIVHSWLPHANIFCKLCRSMTKFNLICSIRGKENTFPHLILRLLERTFDFQSDMIITNSWAFRNYLITTLKYPSYKVRVIYNAFVPANCERGKLSNEIDLEDKKPVSVIANFRPGKDYHTAVSVANAVLEKRKDAIFLFVGDGPLKKETEQLVKSQGLDKRVLFLGTRHDIANIYADSEVFFLPTLYEAQSNTLIEAMHYGCPVVSTDLPENRELIHNNLEGLLIQKGQVQEMANAILLLLNNPNLSNKLSAAAKEKAKQLFDSHSSSKKYLQLYEELIN